MMNTEACMEEHNNIQDNANNEITFDYENNKINNSNDTIVLECPSISEIHPTSLNNSFDNDITSQHICTTPNKNPVNRRYDIGPQHFDLLKLLGEGAFGKVFIVKNCLNNKIYAMKVISKKLLQKKNHILYMKSERELLTKINHPFIISLKFAFQTNTKLFLVMNLLNGGELFYHLRKRGLITQTQTKFYAGEIILAIEFLHSKEIVHRDLKPENILLDSYGHICVTDFGLAKEIEFSTELRTLCGTSEYMAPEMLTRNGYGKAVDWWALGALCYEMMVGHAPFQSKNQKELDRKILNEKIVLPSYLTASSHSLLKGLLEKNPAMRLGCTKSTMFTVGGMSLLKNHAFFEGIDWHDLLHKRITPPIDIVVTSETDISHFSQDFTGQCISSSYLEESLSLVSPATSHPSTPSATTRSRAGSGDNINSCFDDFNYVTDEFTVTDEQIAQFDMELLSKIKSNNKKKKLKAKKEEEKQLKLLQQQKILQEAAENEYKRQLEMEKQRLLEIQRLEKLKLQKKREKEFEDKKLLRVRYEQYLVEVEVINKKIRKFRKKLREISDIEVENEKYQQYVADKQSGKCDNLVVVTAPTSSQLAKLSKRPEAESEIAEAENELVTLESTVNIYSEVVNWGMEEQQLEHDAISKMTLVDTTDTSLTDTTNQMNVDNSILREQSIDANVATDTPHVINDVREVAVQESMSIVESSNQSMSSIASEGNQCDVSNKSSCDVTSTKHANLNKNDSCCSHVPNETENTKKNSAANLSSKTKTVGDTPGAASVDDSKNKDEESGSSEGGSWARVASKNPTSQGVKKPSSLAALESNWRNSPMATSTSTTSVYKNPWQKTGLYSSVASSTSTMASPSPRHEDMSQARNVEIASSISSDTDKKSDTNRVEEQIVDLNLEESEKPNDIIVIENVNEFPQLSTSSQQNKPKVHPTTNIWATKPLAFNTVNENDGNKNTSTNSVKSKRTSGW